MKECDFPIISNNCVYVYRGERLAGTAHLPSPGAPCTKVSVPPNMENWLEGLSSLNWILLSAVPFSERSADSSAHVQSPPAKLHRVASVHMLCTNSIRKR